MMIRDNFPRPDSETVAALGAIPTANLGDALGRQSVMHSRIKGVYGGCRLAGPAYTAKNHPKDNLMSHYALAHASPGDVLVIDTGGFREAAGWGELMTLAAKVRGLGGVIIDGGVRDAAALAQMRFPVFAACRTPLGTVKAIPGSINQPVLCGELIVNAGDIVVGDDDGIVVVPAERAEAALKQARAIAAKEEALRQKVKRGESLYALFGLGKLIHPDP
jgi:4-hydroxy-4-methyl-2-oxoglutarate aldolase